MYWLFLSFSTGSSNVNNSAENGTDEFEMDAEARETTLRSLPKGSDLRKAPEKTGTTDVDVYTSHTCYTHRFSVSSWTNSGRLLGAATQQTMLAIPPVVPVFYSSDNTEDPLSRLPFFSNSLHPKTNPKQNEPYNGFSLSNPPSCSLQPR